MAQNDLIQRYLDAGMQFTQMTRARAEAIVRDLVKAGEVQAEQAQALVADIVDRSRKNTERLVEQIQSEVRKQMSVAEFVTKDTVSRLQSQIDDLRKQLPGPMGGGTSQPAAPKRAAKAPAAKAPAKKAPAKQKAAAKKAAAKKAPAKKAAAKKA